MRTKLSLLGALLLSIAPLARAQNDALVTVVHGIPGQNVDVYVDQQLTLTNFQPGEIAGPLDLAPATYDIDVVAAGGMLGTPIISLQATLDAGQNVSIVAHLNANGQPALTPFVNDVTPGKKDAPRIVIRHVAEAPAVDATVAQVDAFKQRSKTLGTFGAVTNGLGGSLDVNPGRNRVTITPTGSMSPVFGPQDVILESGNAYVFYAYGSVGGGTFDVLVQTIPLATAATVSVIHGVPALTVDVYLNGSLALPNFAPGTITDVDLPGDTYEIAIVAAGGNPGSPIVSTMAQVLPGARLSVVAHLDAAGSPALSIFSEDLATLRARGSALIVRHLAEAPEVDVKLFSGSANKPMFIGTLSGLENGDEEGLAIRSGKFFIEITASADLAPAVDPIELKLKKGIWVAYAVGSLAGGSFQVLLQNIEG